jgi:hypothetical protein
MVGYWSGSSRGQVGVKTGLSRSEKNRANGHKQGLEGITEEEIEKNTFKGDAVLSQS